MMRAMAAWVVVGLTAIGCAGDVVGPPATASDALQPDGIDLLAMGDWGSGLPAQKRVAGAMVNYVRDNGLRPAGVLLAGDNFYVKMPGGAQDPKWGTLFEQMYDPAVLNCPFYTSLGNHDYEFGKAPVELEYARAHPESRWKAPANWYRLDLPAGKPVVTVLMLNSVKDRLSAEQWDEQMRWIEAELSKPRAAFTIVVAHHPLFSNGMHGDNGLLQARWGEIFNRHKVDFFVCGHDHDLQHLEVSGYVPSFVLCGGGGASTRPMRRDDRGPFSRSMHGFVHLRVAGDRAQVRYVDADGRVVHVFARERGGRVEVGGPPVIDKAAPTRAGATTTTTRRAPAADD